MPLVEGVNPSDTGWIELQKQTVASFTDKIRSCIDNSEWEMLSITLESRQAYLEQLFKESISENYRNAIKQLVESILDQDKLFQAKLEEQKDISTRIQLTLERGRRAIKAYNDH